MSETTLYTTYSAKWCKPTRKNQPPHIPTPAEIGTHLHPLLDRMCVEAENAAHPTSFISAGFPPAVKVSGTLTPSRTKP